MLEWFGTDGIRRAYGTFPITEEGMLRLGAAVAQAWQHHLHPVCVLGHDPRYSSPSLARAFAAGASAHGLQVNDLGMQPTPVVAFAVQALRAQVGVVISASHNPCHDNGLKLFDAQGAKIDQATEERLEHLLNAGMPPTPHSRPAAVHTFDVAQTLYVDHLMRCWERPQPLMGVRLVLDAAQGAMSHLAVQVLGALGADLVILAATPNGTNINEGCGALHPEHMLQAVRDHQALCGVAFDGDGDRLVMGDAEGQLINGDVLLYLLARAKLHAGQPVTGVVGTVLSNTGLERALAQHNVLFARSPVGDRAVADLMVDSGFVLGGEPSGHVIDFSVSRTGDPLVVLMGILSYLMNSTTTLAALRQEVVMYPSRSVNLPCARSEMAACLARLREPCARLQATWGDALRLVLRPSGTEPVVRVHAEAQNETLLNESMAMVLEEAGVMDLIAE